jgi:hypothetical protein
MIARLGKDSDRNIAAELDLHRNTVYRKRRLLDIPPYEEPINKEQGRIWTAQDEAMLGKASDRDVAEALGVSATAVGMKRMLLGIPPFQPPNERIEWTDEMIALLGVEPDIEVAARYMVDKGCVSRKREELGVAPAGNRVFPELAGDPELSEILGLTTGELMRRYGVSKATVHRWRVWGAVQAPPRDWRWTEEIVARLGKEPDSRIAKDVGVTAGAVGYMRRRLGIPACPREQAWSDDEVALLGAAPDRDVARRIGRTAESVRAKRRSLGIASKKGTTK